LRARLQQLVDDYYLAGEFLEPDTERSFETSLSTHCDADSAHSLIGTYIQHYKLLRLIDEGGMGTVFSAEQEKPVRRKVALKLIKPGMNSRRVIARFESERQTLAMMDHPNIARVLDAGTTETGQPFFVMELVDGIPITNYCDLRRLSIVERLLLFIQICHAVQHAHQKRNYSPRSEAIEHTRCRA